MPDDAIYTSWTDVVWDTGADAEFDSGEGVMLTKRFVFLFDDSYKEFSWQ